MTKRKTLSKKIRFEIFKRDGFRCRYCGKQPDSETVLEVDHILSVKDGGDSSLMNLVTSCFDCNRGKGSASLKEVSTKINKKQLQKRLNEQKEQVLWFLQYMNAKNELNDSLVSAVVAPMAESIPVFDRYLGKTWKQSCLYFIKKIGFERVFAISNQVALQSQSGRFRNPFIYFCACCHRQVSEVENGKN